MSRFIFAAATALTLVLGGAAMAQDDSPSPGTGDTPAAGNGEAESDVITRPQGSEAADPQGFATMAASSNMLEIASSQLAVENAQQDSVRAFAQRMIEDHTLAGEEMAQAAEADGLAEVPESMSPHHQQMMSQLEAAAPEEFDSQYIDMQVSAHEEAVALFSSYAGQEGALADFAETTLPTLEEHLTMVRELDQGQ